MIATGRALRLRRCCCGTCREVAHVHGAHAREIEPARSSDAHTKSTPHGAAGGPTACCNTWCCSEWYIPAVTGLLRFSEPAICRPDEGGRTVTARVSLTNVGFFTQAVRVRMPTPPQEQQQHHLHQNYSTSNERFCGCGLRLSRLPAAAHWSSSFKVTKQQQQAALRVRT